MEKDLEFIKNILPDHYVVKESKTMGSIHCKSPIGIKEGVDADDDEHWNYIVMAIQQKFGERFLEIDHNTCFCHVDFTICLKQAK